MARGYSENEFVRDDIAEIREFIATESVASADRVLVAIFETIHRIRNHPESFPVYQSHSFQNSLIRQARCLPFKSFLIFFELREKEIRILYVHQARRDFETRHNRERRS